MRHHGDFHLGQILIVKDDVFIIDFEGEPQRTLAERRRKAPAARDVAGFIRSLDYAATAALNRFLEIRREDPARLVRALDAWRAQSTEAFLASMRDTDRATPGCGRIRLRHAERLLRFFLLEKAVYEIALRARQPARLGARAAGGVVAHLVPRGRRCA